LLDLDGLKQINDRFGHPAVNRALCRLAQILKNCSRSVDTPARHGGDEFAIVLPETGLMAASLVARRICDLLAKDTEDHFSLSVLELPVIRAMRILSDPFCTLRTRRCMR
jgi:diguanylate cyclase (GGDEF)-like protein